MDAAWPSTWPEKAEELHIFDPTGDVLLRLRRRQKKDINEGDLVHEMVDEAKFEIEETLVIEEPLDGEPFDEEPHADVPIEEPLDEEPPAEDFPVEDLPAHGPERHWSWQDLPTERDHNATETEPEAEAELEYNSTKSPSSSVSISTSVWMKKRGIEEVQMRVSSKHLILASATFKTSLGSDQFSEGQTLRQHGNVAIELPDEDPDAMVIVLHIIHLQTRRVPRRVDWKMLSKLAFVVDHRRMHEAVEMFLESWIEKLKQDSIQRHNISEVLSRLYIYWVFRQEDDFRSMSQILEKESDDGLEDIADAGPLLPTSIIRNIQRKRLSSIESAIKVIHDLISKYSSPEIICPESDGFGCDAILVGSLMKSSAAIGILPQPETPYPGMTFKALAEQLREMRVLELCRPSKRRYTDYHRVKESICESIRFIEDDMCGIELERFLPEETELRRGGSGLS